MVTAQQVRSYKPDPAHFKECARRIEQAEAELGAHRVGLSDRRGAVPQVEDPGDLGEPPRRGPRGTQEAGRRGEDLPRRRQAAARPLESRLGPPGRPRHHKPDVADQRRRAARGRRGDADRLALLPGRARGAAGGARAAPGFEPDALLATHADFDHVLGSAGVPRARAGARRAERRAAPPEPGAAQRDLRDEDESSTWSGPRRWRSDRSRACQCPGSVELGPRSSSCIRPRATPPTAWR